MVWSAASPVLPAVWGVVPGSAAAAALCPPAKSETLLVFPEMGTWTLVFSLLKFLLPQ